MLTRKIPLSAQIVMSMLIGVAVGYFSQRVFYGVDAVANAFVMLLQMTVIPYITLSLVTGIAALAPNAAGELFKKAGLCLLALISVALVFILIAPLAFPSWESADFYSANTVKPAKDFNIVTLFISANPFHAFANAAIPSVVFFSILVGVGLMRVQSKKQTLVSLNSLQDAVANINTMVMNLAPLGVFCIGLRAAATVNSDQVSGLLVYIATAGTLVALLTFLVLPALVASFTPFSYKQILRASREAMITAFATGSFFIVLPTIVKKTQELLNEAAFNQKEVGQIPSIIVPISFSLPIGGKLIALLFTLFAAWFSGAYISLNEYVQLIVLGLPQLFGSSTSAMGNLLDLFNVSSSMFDFFIVSENLIVGRFGALMSVIFSTCLTLLIATALVKSFTFKPKKFLPICLIIPAISIVAFLGLRFSFQEISHQYQGYNQFIERDMISYNVEASYFDKPQQQFISPENKSDALQRIMKRGFIRVGYFRDDLPYAFHNSEGKLVGFDIEIIHLLALDLGVTIEFVKIFHNEASELLSSGYLDLTTGIPAIPDNLKKFTMSVPYSEQSLALLVKDRRRAEFTDWNKLLNDEFKIIGIPETFFYKNAVEKGKFKGKAWEISTPRLFFKKEYAHIDGIIFGAAAASAWTLLYPDYTVVVPKPIRAPIKMAFPINKNDHNFELYLRNWINIKRQSGSIDALFQYWIEGKSP